MPDRLVVSMGKGRGRERGVKGGGRKTRQSSTLPLKRGSHVMDRGRSEMSKSMSGRRPRGSAMTRKKV